MWRAYSSGYLKNNRAAGLSVVIAAFISALLLSLLCGLFYNFWKYEIERIELESGGWQSRIELELDAESVECIRNFAHVKEVVPMKTEGSLCYDLYFDSMRAVLTETPRIAKRVGISSEHISYHDELLAMHFVRSPQDTAPRLLFPLFFVITALAALSLIVIIHNAFAVSMNARVCQFGIFSSVGATPRQIRTCLLQEAAALCVAPVAAGNLLGIAGTIKIGELINTLLGKEIPGRHEAAFGYHPLVLFAALSVTAITIWISAGIPAGKLSRMTPLEALKNTGELHLKRKNNPCVLAFLFGVEGELAGNALKAQQKALRTASMSFVLAFLAFTLMQCFFEISKISTRETYFARYQDAWDIMVTVKDTDILSFADTKEMQAVQGLLGVESAVLYQKAAAKCIITEEMMSEDMKQNGGFTYAVKKDVAQAEDAWVVNAPLIIMDDSSFLAYCEQIGAVPRLDGAVVLNRIRDVTNPDFRHPQYMPYINEKSDISVINAANNQGTAEIPVLFYTDKVPVLREEYATQDYYELVHFIPVSLWREYRTAIGDRKTALYIRVLGKEAVTLAELNALQQKIAQVISPAYRIESENRIQEYMVNNKKIQGVRWIFGGFCVLLAIIGIGNVFANTFGFVRQRRREIARYLSVGLTPEGFRKMFCIEAVVVAGRPMLLTLPLAAAVVWYMLKLSYLEVRTFLAEAPFIPIGIFMLAIWASVALAYVLGWQSIRRIQITEVLRDDTMM